MVEMTKNIFVTKKLVGEKSLDEMDFVLHDAFGHKYEDDEDFEIIEIGKQGRADGYPSR